MKMWFGHSVEMPSIIDGLLVFQNTGCALAGLAAIAVPRLRTRLPFKGDDLA